MNLARFSQSAIVKAAYDAGLTLTAEQARDIAEIENSCLTESRRMSFGKSAALQLVRTFAKSPFIAGGDAADTISKLTGSFYELREDYPASITDAEIMDSLQKSFDGEAAEDVGLATSLAADALSKCLDYSTYEITDDNGKVYHWNPDEWRDDVTADGWNGERWENVDE